MKTITLPDFLTADQIEQAYRLYQTADDHEFARLCAEEIITPHLVEINGKLGQENDPRYLAYCCQYVFNQLNDRHPTKPR